MTGNLGEYTIEIHFEMMYKGRTIRKVMGWGGGGVGQNQKKNVFPEKN